MTRTPNRPTEKELAILQVLWNKGPSTVREINEALSLENKIGFTTTLKLMQIMFEKELLSREKNGKNHIHKPEISREKTHRTSKTVFRRLGPNNLPLISALIE